MNINIKSIYALARGLPFDDFETVLKSTIARVPNTVKIEGELTCEITIAK